MPPNADKQKHKSSAKAAAAAASDDSKSEDTGSGSRRNSTGDGTATPTKQASASRLLQHTASSQQKKAAATPSSTTAPANNPQLAGSLSPPSAFSLSPPQAGLPRSRHGSFQAGKAGDRPKSPTNHQSQQQTAQQQQQQQQETGDNKSPAPKGDSAKPEEPKSPPKPKLPAEDTPKLQKQRQLVFSEIVSTEKTYCTELKLLVEEYLTPIVSQGLMTNASITASLTALRLMLVLHNRFLGELTKADSEKCCQVFIDFVEFMKNYYAYVQNYPLLNLDFASPNKTVDAFLQKTCKKFNHQNIAQLLILPIQRIPRYVLLLERLEKMIPENNAQAPLMAKALSKIRTVALLIDECRKQSDNSTALFDLQQKVHGIPDEFKILTPTHKFIRQGQLVLLAPDEKVPANPPKLTSKNSRRIIVLNDVLIVTLDDYSYQSRYDLTDYFFRATRGDFVLDVVSNVDENIVELSFVCQLKTERDEWLKVLTTAQEEAVNSENDQLRRKHHGDKKAAADKKVHANGSPVSGALAAPANAAAASGAAAAAAASSSPAAAGGGGAAAAENKKVEPVQKVCEKVNIFMRVRPFVAKEEKEAKKTCLNVDGNMVSLELEEKGKEKVAQYDEVFGVDSSQVEVFDRVGQEILGAFFSGYNATIFAYGNTGAGKTFTMFGDLRDSEQMGLIPRTVKSIFSVLNSPGVYEKWKVKISYVQVYNNMIQDLQGDNTNKEHKEKGLQIKHKDTGIELEGCVETPVKDFEQTMQIIEEGNKRRVVRSHNMNNVSSRSHAVFIIKSKTTPVGSSKIHRSTLHLIDLAGSENAKDTGATGDALVEARHINQSLTALGRVVSILLDNKKSSKKTPVPFRETKLTHLLSDALGGNFICSVILNASSSPVFSQDELTAKTMAFGDVVKKLQISAKPNIEEHQLKHFLLGVWKSVSRNT